MEIKVQAKIALLFTLFLYSYYFFIGLLHPVPALGDSFDYHIPIAKMILSGSFIHPGSMSTPQWYYPGASNVWHSLFIFLHIPLTLSNMLPLLILGGVLWYVGRSFTLSHWGSILFSVSTISLTLFHRWANSVSIDIWVAVYTLAIMVLLRKKTYRDATYLYVGILWGMLIGSKYLVGVYPVLFFLFYGKEFLKQITYKRMLYLLAPIGFLGLFWYFRNYLLTANPFYPLSLLGFKGSGLFLHTPKVWQTILSDPGDVLNAVFSEYKLFSVLFVGSMFFVLKEWKNVSTEIKKLVFCIFGFLGLLLLFPMDPISWVVVSSLRYSYVGGILAILLVFIVGKKYKWEAFVGYGALLSIFPVLTMAYYPKLIIPVGMLFYGFVRWIEPRLDRADKIK